MIIVSDKHGKKGHWPPLSSEEDLECERHSPGLEAGPPGRAPQPEGHHGPDYCQQGAQLKSYWKGCQG